MGIGHIRYESNRYCVPYRGGCYNNTKLQQTIINTGIFEEKFLTENYMHRFFISVVLKDCALFIAQK